MHITKLFKIMALCQRAVKHSLISQMEIFVLVGANKMEGGTNKRTLWYVHDSN